MLEAIIPQYLNLGTVHVLKRETEKFNKTCAGGRDLTKHVKNTIVWEHKIRRPIRIKGRYSTFEQKSVVFSGQNQNKYTGALFLCLVRGTHFQVPEYKFMEECLSCVRQAPCIVQFSQQRDLCVSAQRLDKWFSTGTFQQNRETRPAMLTAYKTHYTDVIGP